MRKDRKQYIFAIKELTGREIKRKYARSRLGIMWSILNPLLTMTVMSLIFTTIFKRSIENFPIYYLTGIIIWTLFSTATNSAMTSLVDNRTLLIKVKLLKKTFVLSRIYTSIINFGYSLIAYALMLAVFRVKINFSMIFLPTDVVLILLFSTGVGYILSIAYVFFADIKYLYGVLLQIWMYMSAIFYPYESLTPVMKMVVGNNPVYIAIAIARECVMEGTIPKDEMWIKLTVWSFASIILGKIVFCVKENTIMQKL